MPLYEYECEANGHRTEVIQRIADGPLEKCPQCGSPVQKLLSAPAFQFKGTGWYVTDYGSKKSGAESGGKSAGGSESSEGKESSSKGESSTEKSAGGGDSSKSTDKKSKSTAAAE